MAVRERKEAAQQRRAANIELLLEEYSRHQKAQDTSQAAADGPATTSSPADTRSIASAHPTPALVGLEERLRMGTPHAAAGAAAARQQKHPAPGPPSLRRTSSTAESITLPLPPREGDAAATSGGGHQPPAAQRHRRRPPRLRAA